jgi:beta-ureidopropionase / N-carbamoyl-L-amino-acid hydrolase
MTESVLTRRAFVSHLAIVAAAPFARTRQKATPLRANGARVNVWLSQFDAIGRTAGGINRVAYSEADLAGRAFTLGLFREAGLAPRIDAAGNILGRLEGSEPSLPPILIGSHVDSVTDGGNFDGPVGSFGAIEVARSLREQSVRLRHPLEVVVWQNEEGGTIGSKLAIGELTGAGLDAVARSGKTIREGIGLTGGSVEKLASAVRTRGSVHAYIELHIEQGGTLERSNLRIGTVTGIVGLRWLDVVIDGFSNHAGTTPMDQRQDALLAASRFTVAVNDTVRAEAGRQVATVGRLLALPNTRNVIPGRVELTVDLRDLDPAKLDRLEARLRQLAAEIGTASGTTFRLTQAGSSAPAMSDTRLMEVIDQSAVALGLPSQRMQSGAGHDAQEIAQIAPMAMIFVPSVGGISHSPREFTKPDDVANGVDVLMNAVVRVDRV